MKKLFLIVLTVVAALNGGFFASAGEAESAGQVIAYYFHGSFRCPSCRFIEENTAAALKENFEAPMKSGELVFKHVNVEEKENRHFVNDYGLYTKSVVLSLVRDGREIRWKNLDQVWHLLRNKDQFHRYVRAETEAFLSVLKEGGES